jgi:hypothetical protein
MSKILKKVRHQVNTVRNYQPSMAEKLLDEYEVIYANGKDLESAKKLHASVYLNRNYITNEQVRDGVIPHKHDPYQSHSQYFAVKAKNTTPLHKKGEVVAVARQIETTEEGIKALPVMHHVNVHPKHAQGEPYEYVEISAFVKKKGVDSNVLLLLFRGMFQHSDIKGHKNWLIACDETVYWRLKTLFPYTIRKIGPKTFYMGSYVMPASVKIDRIYRSLVLAHLLSPPPFRKLRKGLRDIMALNVLA